MCLHTFPLYECDAAAPANNTRQSQVGPRSQLHLQSRLKLSFVNLYIAIKFYTHRRTFSDGAVGRMRHLGTRPAPCGRAAPQPPTRCEDRPSSTAHEKTSSRGEDDADAKTHRESEWHRTNSKEVEGCQEQDDCADMQTRNSVKLKAHGRHDPQLHRPQQKVSILDDLVEEEASMSVTRRACYQHETEPGWAQTSASPAVKTQLSSCKVIS